jgi:hypothetical protein
MRKGVEGNSSLVGYDPVGPWSRPAKACRLPPTFFAFRVLGSEFRDLKGNRHDRSKQTTVNPWQVAASAGQLLRRSVFLEAEPLTFSRSKYAPLRIHLPEVPPQI